MTETTSIQDFVAYAGTLDGDEKSEAQVFLDRLFIAFGHKGHKEVGAKLEERVRKANGKTSFADLRWKDRCLIEMKKRGENLRKHYPVIMAWTPLLLTASVVPEWKCEATTQTSRSVHDEHYDGWY